MAVRLSALRAGRPLTPRKIPGTHFCYRLSRPQGHSAAGRIRSIEKSNDLIGMLLLSDFNHSWAIMTRSRTIP
jgi:hypothetical protein